MNLLERAEQMSISGFLHPAELERLVDLAINRDVLEVGSYRGLSAWGMALTANGVCCVDTFRACSNGQRQESNLTTLDAFLNATRRFNNVRHFVGTSEEMAKVVGEGGFDLIFLDAMHTYEDVKADILRWWPKLRANGIFAMHDYRHHDFPGVAQAADELFGPAPVGTTEITLRWINKQWTELRTEGVPCGSV